MTRRFYAHADFPYINGNKFIDPKMAGWKYSGLAVIQLLTNVPYLLDSKVLSNSEGALIPLSVENVTVKVNEEVFTLHGRRGVFEKPSDWLFCSPDSVVEITSARAGDIAIATAISSTRFPTRYVEALTTIEIRGTGDATREVRPFMHPDKYLEADRLMAVELITPDGNVSSYPPHRHDGMGECKVSNEEIYYFRIGKVGSLHGDPEGFGFHRTYSGPEDSDPFDDNFSIHDEDIYLVPRGYHGPCVAVPGYPMYYLNVLAGDSTPRTMDFCDDPEHAWIRQSWNSQTPDPRIPWRVE